MTRAPRGETSLFGVLATAAIAGMASCSREPARPNVLLISVDTLRADHLGCYGYARDTSPNIDRLASEGVRFECHISSTSWTLPAHAALFTGLPDSLHGCTDTDRPLADSAVTLAERFAAAGYETAGFFSGPYLHPSFGLAQGFERYEDCTSYAALTAGPPAGWIKELDVHGAAWTDVTSPRVFEAVSRWVGSRGRKPFFLFVHLWDPHFDFAPPSPYDTKFDEDYTGEISGKNFLFDERIKAGMDPRDLEHLIALYDGEIAWTDHWIGELRQLLEREGLFDETIVALTSDHGTEFFEHGRKAHRHTLYDELLRVPLVVRYPARVPRATIGAQTRAIDVAPTLVDLAGLPPFENVLGESLLPLFDEHSGVRSDSSGLHRGISNVQPGLSGLRHGPSVIGTGRALSELYADGKRCRSVRTPRWKLMEDMGLDLATFYDLEHDPGEHRAGPKEPPGLKEEALAGYLSEVQAMDAFAREHPVPSAGAGPHKDVPAEVLEQLRRFGYVGEGEEPARSDKR